MQRQKQMSPVVPPRPRILTCSVCIQCLSRLHRTAGEERGRGNSVTGALCGAFEQLLQQSSHLSTIGCWRVSSGTSYCCLQVGALCIISGGAHEPTVMWQGLCWHLISLTWLISGVLERLLLFSGMLTAGLPALDVLRRGNTDLQSPCFCACDGPGAVATYIEAWLRT